MKKSAAKSSPVKSAPRDVCAEITAKLVAALESGVAPWVKPWVGDGGVPAMGGMPCNAVTGRSYHGANVLVLWCAGFTDPRWLTFQQAVSLGGSVRKGEKGQTVCWWSPITKKAAEGATAEDDTPRTHLVCRAYTVFNVSQCDGLKLDTDPVDPPVPVTDMSVADAVATRVGAKVAIGGSRAYYSPSSDMIGMPTKEAFVDSSSHDATLLHELTHWTGHATRLDRDWLRKSGLRSPALT